MEKYYHEDLSNFKRTKKNQNLYKEVYGYEELDNIPIPDNSDVIDVDSLKKMVTSRGEYQKLKEYDLVKTTKQEEKNIEKEEKQEIYDINELLTKAKEENSKVKDISLEEIKKEHNFLYELDSIELPDKDEQVHISEVKYHTKQISKDPIVNQIINTNSLPLDILTDLKPTEDTIVSEPILEETRKLETNPEEKTFYSGSYTFSKKDFLDNELLDNDNEHSFIKVMLLVLGLSLLATLAFYFLKYYGII